MLLQDSEKDLAPALERAHRAPSTAAAPPAEPRSLGQTWQFRLAMLRYHRLVYRVAWGIMRETREAEDICQEVFARFWQHLPQVRQTKEWLLRVARNEALSRWRRQRRVQLSDDLEPRQAAPWQPEPAEAVMPDDYLQRQQRAQVLRRAVELLPEPQRSLIILFDLEGQDGETCARILELSVNQVKVYLHRARKRLRVQLERAL